MMSYHLRFTGEEPLPPRDADFSFTIDFKKGEGSPRRVFDAASQLIEAFESLDNALVGTFGKSLEPLLVLEDVETGSLKVWLKNILARTDDEAIKGLEWQKLIGKYLVRAKYIVMEYCDRDDVGQISKIDILKDVFHKLAEETDARHVPDYPKVDDAKLINAISKVQHAKSELTKGDRLIIEVDGREYEADLTQTRVPVAGAAGVPSRDGISEGEMTLIVRKPDLLKDSMWQFMHGKTPISAQIQHQAWLEDFRNRNFALFPGDALRCRVKHKYTYNKNNNLESDKIDIVEVLDIIPGTPPQEGLF